MSEEQTSSEAQQVAASTKRVRASGPILILAVLFVVASFLAWYFTWFGRGLSDSDISKYLVDEKHPRHVQHALLQIQQRIERGDQNAKQWYPQVIALAANPETEFRLTVAWLMGADNSSADFHRVLKQLLLDNEPIVRRNAALALVRFNDAAGRPELLAMLQPFTLKAPASGALQSSLASGALISRGTLLGRIQTSGNEVIEVRSPLAGKVSQLLVTSGATLEQHQPMLTINADEGSIWEALRGLALIGEVGDIPLIERYANSAGQTNDKVKQQAALTLNAIKSRGK